MAFLDEFIYVALDFFSGCFVLPNVEDSIKSIKPNEMVL